MTGGVPVSGQPLNSWTHAGGGANHDFPLAVAVNDNQDSFITGESKSPTFSVGGLTLTNQGNHAIFVARLDALGNAAWAWGSDQIAPGNFTRGLGAASDASGGAYIVGALSGTVDFGITNHSSAGFSDMFLARFDAAGTLVWLQRGAGATAADRAAGYRVALDSSGQPVVAGQFSGHVQLTSAAGTNVTVNGSGIFFAKYDQNGNLVWVRTIDGTIYPTALFLGGSDRIHLAGNFSSATAQFGSTTLTNSGFENGFVAQYDAGGTLQWARQIGGGDSDWPTGAGCDSNGNVFVAGNTLSEDTLIHGVPFAAGDRLLAKFSSDGDLLWAKTPPLVGRIAVGPAGRVSMAGDFKGNVSFGNNTLTNSGDNFDGFIAQFDEDGNPVWAKAFGGPNLDRTWDVAVNRAGDILMTGEFQGIAKFDGSSLTNQSSLGDAFVGRISGPPILDLQLNGDRAVLSWPLHGEGYRLQTTSGIETGDWSSMTNIPSISQGRFVVTNQVSPPRGFFRLVNP
jgi:hypothetical protein